MLISNKDISLFNFFGVSCIDLKNRVFKISKKKLFLNYLKFSLIFIYKIYYEFFQRDSSQRQSFYNSKGETKFASVIHSLELFSFTFVTISSYILQNLNFRKVEKCLSTQRKLKLNNHFKKEYFKNCKTFKIYMILYFLICNSFFVKYKLYQPLLNQIMWILTLYFQCFTLLLFYLFVIIQESQVFQLKQLRNDILMDFSLSNIETTKLELMKISKSFQNFRDALETQISIQISFYVVGIVFSVKSLSQT